jgi:hypothetical protein
MVDRNHTAYHTILYGVAITGNIHLDHFPWLARRHLPLPLTSKSALPASGPGATRKRRTKEKLSQTNTHQKGGTVGLLLTNRMTMTGNVATSHWTLTLLVACVTLDNATGGLLQS